MTITWREAIIEAMSYRLETWDDLEAVTLSNAELDEPFDDGFGLKEGKPFTAWTVKSVYVPVCYDGAEWVAGVPRHPCNKPTSHLGG